MSKPVKESASFRIKNGDTAVSFRVEGSTVAALVEAFSYLTPERRLHALEQMQTKQLRLLAREAAPKGAAS